MARLATGLATALVPTPSHTLMTGESVRGGWFRCDGGVLVTQSKLTFEIGDLLLRVGDFLGRLRQTSLALRQFAPESLILSFQPFLGGLVAPSLGLRHALHGTPIRSTCTEP